MEQGYISSHIGTTVEEKINAMEVAKQILKLAQVSRDQGLLALENFLPAENSAWETFLRIGIEYVIDGRDPSEIRVILENYIISSQWSGLLFLEGILILEGILSIQEGTNLNCIQESLASYFGIEFRPTFFDTIKNMKVNSRDTLEDILKPFSGKTVYSKKTALLEELVQLSDASIQKLLKHLDNQDLIWGLSGASEKVIVAMFRNLSVKLAGYLAQDLMNTVCREEECIQSQEKIISVLKRLVEKEEI